MVMTMKKFGFISLAAIAIAMLASCSKEIAETPQVVPEGMIPVTFEVCSDALTKADLSGLDVVWTVGDKIAVFDGISESANEFTVGAVEGTTAIISGLVSEGTTEIYAVSPYSAARSLDAENHAVNFRLTQPQIIPEGASIAPEALIQVAKAGLDDATIAFKNVVSLIQFSISAEDVTDVLIFPNASDKLLGDSKAIFAVDGSVTTEGLSLSRIKVTSSADVFAPGTYYCGILASEATEGLTFAATGAEYKYVRATDKAVTFQARKGLNFGDITGTDAEVVPTLIKTKADLDKWAANATIFLKSDVVSLANDIDCGGAEWNPVVDFYGGFDGKGHSIYNFKITSSAHSDLDYLGFFYNLPNDNLVKDLAFGLKDGAYDGTSTITIDKAGTAWVGTLVGILKNTSGASKITVSNVSNYVPITINKATTEKDFSIYAGGLVGRVGESTRFEVTGCKNYGAITNISKVALGGQYYGGLFGGINSGESTIRSCENHAAINLSKNGGGTLQSASFAGGIIARVNPVHGLVISECSNDALVTVGINVKQACYMGGIVGMDHNAVGGDGYDISFVKCVNEGKILAGAESGSIYMGGILGYSRAKILISECRNKGLINKDRNHTAQSAYGGILGIGEGCEGALLDSCTNTGELQETGAVTNTAVVIHAFGGIVGLCNIDVKDCINSGDITLCNTGAGTLHVIGGIVGQYGVISGKTNRNAVISNCTNTGNLSSTLTAPAGGLVGRMATAIDKPTFAGCEVNCVVNAATPANAGMIAGLCDVEATFGTVAAPVQVKGSKCGTAMSNPIDSYYLYGSASAVTPTVNAVYWAE